MNPLRALISSLPARTPDADSFGRHAEGWWDAAGPMAPLHRLNPVRLVYLKQVICAFFARDPQNPKPYEGLHMLDLGCGGGLVSEPLARLGARVTGLDSSPDLIAAAREHAAQQKLDILYQAGLSGGQVVAGETYDVVLALEVIEHVDDPAALLADIRALLRPSGIAIVSTLNRTPQSWLKGILAAEYLLRWVPRGTHEWHRFLRPHELAALATDAGLQPAATMGLHYDALRQKFSLRADRLEVNYFMVLRHA